MATNWNAYQAAKELYGNNTENIQDIGSRFPLFSRAVMQVNDEALLDILGAIPKVSARVMETGLKALADGDAVEEADAAEEEPMNKPEEKAEKKSGGKNAGGKKTKKSEPEPEDDGEEDEEDYESMTTSALYKLCCKRGISSQCKKRDKASLIAVLKANEDGAVDSEEDDWGDEEEEEKDPYAGKTAKELYKMCVDRGIKTKMKLSTDAYVKLLKKADAEAAEQDEDEDDDDEWEI